MKPGRYSYFVLSAAGGLHGCPARHHSLALLIVGCVTLSKLGNPSLPQFPHLLNEVMTDLPRVAMRIEEISTMQSIQHSPDTDTCVLPGCWLSPLLGGREKAECGGMFRESFQKVATHEKRLER